MKHFILKILLVALPIVAPMAAATPKVAVIGLLHSHVWTQLPNMVRGDVVQLVGVAETHPELIAEAKKLGVADNLFFPDYQKMLDTVKPDFVWAFVENNRHLEIVKACALRKVHVIFEKPLASTAKDAMAIRDIANKSGIYVMTNYQMPWGWCIELYRAPPGRDRRAGQGLSSAWGGRTWRSGFGRAEEQLLLRRLTDPEKESAPGH